ALAVEDDAVEAAVVEDYRAPLAPFHQRVAARDRRVLEDDVGGVTAPEPGGGLAQGDEGDLVAVGDGEIAARRRLRQACRRARALALDQRRDGRRLAGEGGGVGNLRGVELDHEPKCDGSAKGVLKRGAARGRPSSPLERCWSRCPRRPPRRPG